MKDYSEDGMAPDKKKMQKRKLRKKTAKE